jgi:hypothetical protein
VTTPTPTPLGQCAPTHVKSRQIAPSHENPKKNPSTPTGGVPTDRSKSAGCPTAAQVCARVQKALNDQRRQVPGPLVRQPAPAAKVAAILHNARWTCGT